MKLIEPISWEQRYGDLVQLAAEYLAYHGYLNPEELKRQAMARGKFDAGRNRLVYDLLKQGDAQAAAQSIDTHLGAMRAAEDDPWNGVIDFIIDELQARLASQSRMSPALRRVVRWTPAAIVVALLIAYFTVRAVSGVTIDQPLESAQGLRLRAEATQKVLRYDDWAGGRRGWIKGLILWPIEPDEAEIAGARAFAEVVAGGYAQLEESRALCGGLPPHRQGQVNPEEIALVADVAASVRAADAAAVRDLPSLILDPIKAKFPCPR